MIIFVCAPSMGFVTGSEATAAPLPCAVLPVSVLHDDTDSIVHQANVTNELRLQRGQRVRDTLKHSRDYVAIDAR